MASYRILYINLCMILLSPKWSLYTLYSFMLLFCIILRCSSKSLYSTSIWSRIMWLITISYTFVLNSSFLFLCSNYPFLFLLFLLLLFNINLSNLSRYALWSLNIIKLFPRTMFRRLFCIFWIFALLFGIKWRYFTRSSH